MKTLHILLPSASFSRENKFEQNRAPFSRCLYLFLKASPHHKIFRVFVRLSHPHCECFSQHHSTACRSSSSFVVFLHIFLKSSIEMKLPHRQTQKRFLSQDEPVLNISQLYIKWNTPSSAVTNPQWVNLKKIFTAEFLLPFVILPSLRRLIRADHWNPFLLTKIRWLPTQLTFWFCGSAVVASKERGPWRDRLSKTPVGFGCRPKCHKAMKCRRCGLPGIVAECVAFVVRWRVRPSPIQSWLTYVVHSSFVGLRGAMETRD